MTETKEWKTVLSFTAYLQLSLLRTLWTMTLSRGSSNSSLSLFADLFAYHLVIASLSMLQHSFHKKHTVPFYLHL